MDPSNIYCFIMVRISKFLFDFFYIYLYNHNNLLLYSGAVGVSLYGNDDLHNGVVKFLTSARALDDLVISVKNQVITILK